MSGRGAAKPNTTPVNSNNPRIGLRSGDKSSLVTPEDTQGVRSAEQGRKLLERESLLVPAGQKITTEILVFCLRQIAQMDKIAAPIQNAIQSVAYILEEHAEEKLEQNIKDIFSTQINEHAADWNGISEKFRQQIDEQVEKRMKDLEEATTQFKAKTEAIIEEMGQRMSRPGPTHQDNGAMSYSRAVIQSVPAHANPRVAAREGIRARQIMLEGFGRETELGKKTEREIKETVNTKLDELGAGGRARSTTKQRSGGLLVEMETDGGAVWLRDRENQKRLCEALGPKVQVKTRTFNLIAFNVPLTLEPDNKKHLEEIQEANDLYDNQLTATRWAKPIARRTPGQKSAHLILTYNDIDAANRAIAKGLKICNKWVHVQKIRKEPTRCLKCQKYGHFAKECPQDEDTCSTCATKGHRSNECPTPETLGCISCNAKDHASWSRECPTFIRKTNECNRYNPENDMPFIPSTEAWTWTTNLDQHRPTTQNYATPPPIQVRQKTQQARKAQEKANNSNNNTVSPTPEPANTANPTPTATTLDPTDWSQHYDTGNGTQPQTQAASQSNTNA